MGKYCWYYIAIIFVLYKRKIMLLYFCVREALHLGFKFYAGHSDLVISWLTSFYTVW